MLGSGLSSCLDDTSSASMSGTDFAVIRRIENITEPVAYLANGLILKGGEISKYTAGDAIILTYNVDLSNQSNGVVEGDATNIKVTDEFPYSSQESIVIGTVDTLVQNKDNMFESLAVKAYSGNQFLNDKWLFLTKASIKEGQIMDLEFYYDAREGMQHTSTGTPLQNDVIVVDVKLNLRGQGDGTATSQEKYFVVDLSKLRSEIFKNAKETTQCKIWLRYYDKSKNDAKPTYVQNVGGLIHETSTSN